MATTPIKYRISSVATKPTTDSVKGAPLTSLEIDGNFRSIKDSIDAEGARLDASIATQADRIDDIILNGIGSILARHSATATAGQTVFDLPFTYSPGANNLVVFVNGLLSERGADYTETSGTRVTFNSGLEVGQEVTFLTNVSPAPAAPLYSVAGITSYTLTSNGVLTSFALPVAVLNKDNTQVFVNGIYQEKSSYSIAGSTLVFSEAPVAGKVEIVVQSSLAIGEALANSVSYTPAGTGAVATTVQSKLREFVSVKDFGAKGDGVTNDWAAIQAANEYLKANGGGTLYFPGWCLIDQPFYHYGDITGGWSLAYPSPNQAKITWASNGQGGIKVGSGITSGDVIRLSKPSTSTALNYTVGFSDFAIDCSGKNVTALNGLSHAGIYGANHIVSVDGLYINGIQGVDAIGVDFGTITDSEIHRLRVQGYGTGPYAGVRLNKANIQLHSYTATFCKHSIVVGSLTEACIQMFGGSLLAPKQSHIHWESASADYKSSASVIVGAFIGETNTTPTTTQGPIMSCASPSNLDIGVITFIGCGFDNWTGSTNLMNIDWGGKFNFIGCNTWSPATGNKSIKFGQYCFAWMFNNKEIAVDTSGAGAIAGQVQGNFQAEAVAFTPALAATGSTFSYSSRNGYYTRVGNLVTVSIRIQLNTSGNTFTGNALTITGLPFPISDKTFSHIAFPCEWFSTATAMNGMTALLVQNSSTLSMYKKTAATTSSFATTLLDTDIGATSGGGLYVTFTYQAAPGY